ncbi:BREX-1 system adenine-specific DNA-methyltransferase PglX [Kocuria marina]|uniref:BREX-1 system adenine-specific DNA-methyltransferase PglX n=1 Tax=Kocuria marina TaxID=223184 RepID=UPI003F1F0E08
MDTTLLKSFATSSRTELIREVAARITAVLAPGSPERVEQPRAVSELERAISVGGGGDKGKAHVADKVAYTWFNRIIALRFMDANGYTGIGVVSPAADQVGQPEILAAAKRGQVDGDVVKGANVATVTGLLNGTRQPRPGVDAQAEAYSLLLADYCRYWNRAMPFMFEREGDFTELLIPANVLAEDSVLSRSVTVLTEEVCQDVEVIGWLYQFYISERKDEVFAGFKKNKKAGADEIPAATQLFTPHWIVRYLIENSVGRLWMLNHPESRLVDQMDYYIAPVDEEKDFLKITKPEELRVIDPACGSGHMLTYAFDLLYAIYEEEGYTPSQIPGLILKNNLYGTEIDPRAGALAAFALTMKAVAKRKLFLKNPVAPNICVLEPISFSTDELGYLVTKDGDRHAEEAFWNQFAEADTFGALIQPDSALTIRLADHIVTLDDRGELLRADALLSARRVSEYAKYLSRRYAAIVANPPYLIGAKMGDQLSEFARTMYPDTKSDLYAMFIERALLFGESQSVIAMVTMQSWMFIVTFETLRDRLLVETSIHGVAHLGTAAFESIGGDVVSTVAFVIDRTPSRGATGTYLRLVNGRNGAEKSSELARVAAGGPAEATRFDVPQALLMSIPARVFAYWLGTELLTVVQESKVVDTIAAVRQGLSPADKPRFMRTWWEVSFGRTALSGSGSEKWFPYNKGGGFRRWYGNVEHVINWQNDGAEIRAFPRAAIRNPTYYRRPHITWSKVSSGRPSFRWVPEQYMFDGAAGALFVREPIEWKSVLGFLNSTVIEDVLEAYAPTLNFTEGNISALPVPSDLSSLAVAEEVERLVEASAADWATSETSWDFVGLDLRGCTRIEEFFLASKAVATNRVKEMHALENAIDVKVSTSFGLREWKTSSATNLGDLPLRRNPFAVESRSSLTEEVLAADLASYGVGCMFGRYSMDEPGLILADQGATMQDYLAKVPNPVFTPDIDNVIPIVDGDWFEDDIVERFRQFLRATFGEQHFEENLQFVTKSLGVKHLRDYFVKSFYKDHVKRYKKRPIYWLFSSPKGSFNALIYMHRYTPSTVSTVLTYLREYVTKLESALQQAERAGNAKEADRLRKILVELNEYEHDTLFPKASENIVIDLDDGVKVNYPKFGAALKKVPGLEAASD